MVAQFVIHSPAGSFDAFLAEPPGTGKVPAIVLVPSIMGVTEGIKITMERYAAKGFIVISADPFWRTHPGPLDHSRMQEALARNSAWSAGEGVADMEAELSEVGTLPRWNGKWAVVGFCFGGEHAIFALSRMNADASVAFHGVNCERYLDEADRITTPFSLHFGELDDVVPLTVVDEVRAGLASKDGEIYVYPGAHHGFAQDLGPGYNAEAATLSEERAFAVLDRLH